MLKDKYASFTKLKNESKSFEASGNYSSTLNLSKNIRTRKKNDKTKSHKFLINHYDLLKEENNNLKVKLQLSENKIEELNLAIKVCQA